MRSRAIRRTGSKLAVSHSIVRILAAEIPVHDDELLSIGAVVGSFAVTALLIAALAPPGATAFGGLVDADARELVRRGTVHFAPRETGRSPPSHRVVPANSAAPSPHLRTDEKPKPKPRGDVIRSPSVDEHAHFALPEFLADRRLDAFDERQRAVPAIADIDLHVDPILDDDALEPQPRPRMPDPAPYDPFICIYPGHDYRDFREAVRHAVLRCAHQRLWGTVAHDAAGFHVAARVGDAIEAQCIERDLDRSAPKMIDEVSAPFFFTPDDDAPTTSRTGPTPGSSARPPP